VLEERHELGEVVVDPLLVQKALAVRLYNLINLRAVICAHSELRNEHRCLESVKVNDTVLVVVLFLPPLDNGLRVTLEGLLEVSERGGAAVRFRLGGLHVLQDQFNLDFLALVPVEEVAETNGIGVRHLAYIA